ncbi:MAG: protein tyrosine phosphatase family protein [Planctomycetota bacterium]|nr:protein tyrosine phosphatase family protein [Planctomycetota bacterium]
MKFTTLVALALLPSLALTSCESFEEAIPEVDPGLVRSELGEMRNTTEWGDFYMGGQPTETELMLAAKRGVTRVINIRSEPEVASLTFDEAGLCADLDIEYIHVPVTWESLTDDEFDLLMDVLNEEAPGKTLFHCGSGNRVSVFVAAHRVMEANVSFEDAVADARTAGMKPDSKPVLEEQLKRLTGQNPE